MFLFSAMDIEYDMICFVLMKVIHKYNESKNRYNEIKKFIILLHDFCFIMLVHDYPNTQHTQV